MGWIDREPPEWSELLRRQAAPRTGLHCTDLISCPRRRAAIALDTWPVELKLLEARLFGNILHGARAGINPETSDVRGFGKLFGYSVVGSVDRMEREPDGRAFTCDYKTGEEDKRGRLPEAPYPAQVFQQEAYRYLLNNDSTIKTSGWRIYYRRNGGWKCYEHVGPVWTEDQLGDFKPGDGRYTVRDIAELAMTVTDPALCPMVGETIPIGKGTSCDYCEVAGPCKAAGLEIEL